MSQSRFNLNLKFGQKATLRDKKGRPHYLANLPFYRRYPRLFLSIGAAIGFFSVTGPFIIKAIITDQSKLTLEDTLWPSEKTRGKTNLQRWKEKYSPEKYAQEMAEIEAAKKRVLELEEQARATPGESAAATS